MALVKSESSISQGIATRKAQIKTVIFSCLTKVSGKLRILRKKTTIKKTVI